jgi:hypothetical protein
MMLLARVTSYIAACLLLLSPLRANAQAEPTAYGPGTYIQVGSEFSTYQIDYGQRYLGGAGAFIDANLYRRIGVEVEARNFTINESEGVHDTTYLVGPRISIFKGRFRPYSKLLTGRGEFYFPFHYAKGSYFVIAPGFGVDWYMRKSRFAVRLIDVEIQNWPGFSFGQLKPYGVSSGLMFRVF